MTRNIPTLAVIALAALPMAVRAQDTEWNRYTLEKLGGVHVRIDVAEPCEAAGVKAADFEASTSLKLIDADVGVLTQEEMLENPALPELRVTLDCANGGSGPLAYSVGLRVQQAAQLLRDTQVTLPEAVTWYSHRIGVATASNAPSSLEGALTEELTAFADAWKAANTIETEGSSR